MELVLKVPDLKPVEGLGTVKQTIKQNKVLGGAELRAAGVVVDAGGVAVAVAVPLVEVVAEGVAEADAVKADGAARGMRTPNPLVTQVKIEFPTRRDLRIAAPIR